MPTSAHKTIFVDFLSISVNSNSLVLLLLPFQKVDDKFPGSGIIMDSWCLILLFQITLKRFRTNVQNGVDANGDASNSMRKLTTSEDVLNGLVEWLSTGL